MARVVAALLLALALGSVVHAAGGGSSMPKFSKAIQRARRVREWHAFEREHFPALFPKDMQADADDVAALEVVSEEGLSIVGSQCTCRASTKKATATSKASFSLAVSCISSKGRANFLPGCNCFGTVVMCPTDLSGKAQIIQETYSEGLCANIVPGVTDSGCQGDACPDQGFQLTTIQRRSISTAEDKAESCEIITQRTVCTNSKACDCQFTSTPFGTCSKTCGTGVHTRTNTITRPASNGGQACPATTETESCKLAECAVDCVVGDFSPYSACSSTCGSTAVKTRSRAILVPASNGGKACPTPLTQTVLCTGLPPCPENCTYNAFSEWSTCSASCGNGTSTRTRTIKTNAAHGGTCTGALSETKPCNLGQCPVDCVVTDFSNWTSCSKTCGGGSQTRRRKVVTPSQAGGKACPTPLEETQECNVQPCAVDCALTPFGNWTVCAGTCGEGTQSRFRSIIRVGAHGGVPCAAQGPLTESRSCDTGKPCPIDCKTSNFSEWSDCSHTCGGGTQTRSRTILQDSQHGGLECGLLTQSRECNVHECPVDAVCGAWTSFSNCTAPCGGGTQTRTRKELTPAKGTGRPCALSETKECNLSPCPVDCVVSPFSNFSDCNAMCGGGLKQRNRVVITNAANGGKTCPPLVETQECNTTPCSKNCSLSKFSDWSKCSQTCGGGTQARNRSIISGPVGSGNPCGSLNEVRSCNTEPCPVDCVVSQFGEFGNCSVPCGGGTMTRKRTVLTPAQNGGRVCPVLEQSAECHVFPCPLDCVVSDWSAFSSCSQTCGSGVSSRTRKVVTPPKNGGADCPALSETVPCEIKPCPVPCVVGNWSAFTGCSATCGNGTRTRSRAVLVPAKFNGTACPHLTETQPCNAKLCPVHCEVTPFGAWSSCSVSCGGGNQQRTRTVATAPTNGGEPCPILQEIRECNVVQCPVHCQLSAWSNFGSCSKSCGGGKQTRTRKVIQAPAHNGTACGALEESQPCNTQGCPVPCKVSSWGPYSNCSAACSGGQQVRRRTILSPAQNGGEACPPLLESRECNTTPCSSSCELSPWSPFSGCSQTCGGGAKVRVRSIVKPPAHGGQPCGALNETVPCNSQPCPVNCTVSAWSTWSKCSAECDTGSQTRTRKIITSPANGGMQCPGLIEVRDCASTPCQPRADCPDIPWTNWSACSKSCGTGFQTRHHATENPDPKCGPISEVQTCNAQPCPEDCKLSKWTAWTECSHPCGDGMSFRYRSVEQPARYGGKACGSLMESKKCGAACPKDCVVSNWSAWTACTEMCGGKGVKSRVRKVLQPSTGGGKPCPELRQSVSCQPNPCKVDCQVSAWSEWTSCSSTCGGGHRVRHRAIVRKAANGGAACPPLTQVANCNTAGCASNCSVSSWSGWGSCQLPCGGGVQSRHRTVLHQAVRSGQGCPKLAEQRPCNTKQCPVKCHTSTWSSWSPCSNKCGAGVSHRWRRVLTAPTSHSHTCGPLVQSRRCHSTCAGSSPTGYVRAKTLSASSPTHVTKVFHQLQTPTPASTGCKFSAWSSWTPCRQQCKTSPLSSRGLRQRTRTVLHAPHAACHHHVHLVQQAHCRRSAAHLLRFISARGGRASATPHKLCLHPTQQTKTVTQKKKTKDVKKAKKKKKKKKTSSKPKPSSKSATSAKKSSKGSKTSSSKGKHSAGVKSHKKATLKRTMPRRVKKAKEAVKQAVKARDTAANKGTKKKTSKKKEKKKKKKKSKKKSDSIPATKTVPLKKVPVPNKGKRSHTTTITHTTTIHTESKHSGVPLPKVVRPVHLPSADADLRSMGRTLRDIDKSLS